MTKWIPWRLIVKRLARYHGFLDPLTLYARLQQFAQPSEVAEPVELLRAGAIFHARGLINSRVLQHNLDWVWPYWIERQFNPADLSFLPRAFSLTHVNLTHRNWTAVGLPGRVALPIVDPRGLLMPFWDSWSIDVWCMNGEGEMLLPSRAQQATQTQTMGDSLSVVTCTAESDMELTTSVTMAETAQGDVCRLSASARIPSGGWLIVSVRPCNPEGVSFIDHIALDSTRTRWTVNNNTAVHFDQQVQQHHTSHYSDADVYVHLKQRGESMSVSCNIGLATAAAMFHILPDGTRDVQVEIPIMPKKPEQHSTWVHALEDSAVLDVPDKHYVSLFDAAMRTLVLCTPDEACAGPYTYKRYWYRDAVFIGHGLLCAGLVERTRHLVSHFPRRQTHDGYYHSQEGEWDANGEVLWLADRLRQFSGERVEASLWRSLRKGADWLCDKRLPDYGGQAHEGLLPAGFSAEHLGPNDHYYWDNYWAVAGLEAAERIANAANDTGKAAHYSKGSTLYRHAIARSFTKFPNIPGMPAIPAAPSRRMDAGAIGSVVVSYPLKLCDPRDVHLLGTLEFLLDHTLHQDGFFQDMIHSGVNAYLTLQIAQALLRAGDTRYERLVRAVARLASPTGHWPEAIHPNTGGGCMGDGHHAWAAAEWIAMMRYCFIREESGTLVLGSGLLPDWLASGERMSYGPVPTEFGRVSLTVAPEDSSNFSYKVIWEASWHLESPEIRVALPGFAEIVLPAGDTRNFVTCRRCAV